MYVTEEKEPFDALSLGLFEFFYSSRITGVDVLLEVCKIEKLRFLFLNSIERLSDLLLAILSSYDHDVHSKQYGLQQICIHVTFKQRRNRSFVYVGGFCCLTKFTILTCTAINNYYYIYTEQRHHDLVHTTVSYKIQGHSSGFFWNCACLTWNCLV